MRLLKVFLALGATLACGTSTPTSPATASPGASPTAQVFAIDLPVAAGDTAQAAYGIWPFGVHGASHALDGHPGFDVEFRPGASVLAAADGAVQHVTAEAGGSGRFTIRIQHAAGGQTYATDYTNISAVAAGIAAGAAVARGQALGTAGVQTQMIGTSSVTWAMTHFQVNDFSKNEGLTHPNAVSPESYLSPSARAAFDALWATAAYSQELTEPMATNPRGAAFPLTRVWMTMDAAAVSRIDFTHADPADPGTPTRSDPPTALTSRAARCQSPRARRSRRST